MHLKHGYTTMKEFRKDAQRRFSLLETGVIQQPSTRLLLINVYNHPSGFVMAVDTDW